MIQLMQVRNQAIENINYDLKLIKLLGGRRLPQYQGPKNLKELSQVLRLKNPTEPSQQDQLEKGRQWLLKKGIDLDPNLAKNMTPESETTETPKEQDSYYFLNLTEGGLEEYRTKAYENAAMNIMQAAMRRGGQRRKFNNRVLERTERLGRLQVSWECQAAPQRRDLYRKIVRQAVSRSKEYASVLTEVLNELVHHKIQGSKLWHVLGAQLSKYSPSDSVDDSKTKLLVACLGLVQQEFAERLRGTDMAHYLSSNYLNKIEGRYMPEKGVVWGQVWAYMAAGMHKQAIELIASNYRNYNELINAYSGAETSIQQGNPVRFTCRARNDINDVFYDQILFALNGDSKFSCEIMSQPQSLELVWVLLRTTGIFWKTNRDQFLQVRQAMIDKYQQSPSQSQFVMNMLYLGDFDSVVKLGPNALLTKEDYLHFLIVLSAFPGLIEDQECLQKALIDRLVQHILELMLERKEEYVHYIALLPPEKLPSEVSAIIVSSDALNSFNWATIAGLIEKDLYLRLVNLTIERYVLLKGDYLQGAVKLNQLVKDVDGALHYLTLMMVRHYTRKQIFPLETVIQAEQLAAQLSANFSIIKVYHDAFQLFANCRQLKTLLRTRNHEELQQCLGRSRFIILDAQAHYAIEEVLKKLAEFKGVGVYFDYLRSAVKAAEIYMTQLRKTQELGVFKQGLLLSCQRLMETQSAAYASEQNEAELFVVELRASM